MKLFFSRKAIRKYDRSLQRESLEALLGAYTPLGTIMALMRLWRAPSVHYSFSGVVRIDPGGYLDS